MMEAASVTGPAKNLIGFCRWLDTAQGMQTGLRISIATFDRDKIGNGSNGFANAARADGIDTYVIRERHRFDLGVTPQIREIVAHVNPHIIQTHNGKSHLLLRSLSELRAHRAWIAFQHGYQHTDLKLRLYNQVDRLTLRYANRVISVCQAFTPRLVACGVQAARIRILHNAAVPTRPIPEAARKQVRSQFGIRNGESVVLTIGRLSKEKGHADLVRALKLLREIPWKMVLVGVGPERDALTTLAASLGISDRVVFAGFNPDVAAFYAIANVFVLPSHSEGSSNVLLEAMATGVPIVATSAGGNPEIVVDDDTGLLVPVGDSRALANAITRLLQEPDLAARVARAAAIRAEKEFSVERYQRRLSGIYAEVLESQSSDRLRR